LATILPDERRRSHISARRQNFASQILAPGRFIKKTEICELELTGDLDEIWRRPGREMGGLFDPEQFFQNTPVQFSNNA
jgi:hypothetical protein